MFEFKLQMGCLIIISYFIISYVKSTYNPNYNCNKIFDILIVVAPWAIVFDGVTAWSVNHMDIVPGWLNLLLHGVFFLLMDAVLIITYAYMVSITVKLEGKSMRFSVFIPGIISVVLILAFLKDLYYVEGKTTNYSMGTSVIICYTSMFVYFLMIMVLLALKHRTLERHQMRSFISFMALDLCILVAQIIAPEILISSLLPVVSLISIYVNFENPALRKLKEYNDDMVIGFARLVDKRDGSTGGHIIRTKEYVRIIINELMKRPEYSKMMTRDYIADIINSAPMHDIGKIATPDSILLKESSLLPEEYDAMKNHAEVGGDIIKEIFKDMDDPEYQKIAYEVARYHHEKWNGKGYPEGLSGTDIPFHARIMAIADVFDALSARRCYKEPIPLDKCFKIIEEGAGVDFDPELVEIFMDAREEVENYYDSSLNSTSGINSL